MLSGYENIIINPIYMDLYKAIKIGDLNEIKKSINASNCRNFIDMQNKITISMAMVLHGQYNLLSYLLTTYTIYCKKNSLGDDITHLAARLNKPDILTLLLNNNFPISEKDANNHTPLDIAIENKFWECAILIVKHGSGIIHQAQFQSALYQAIINKQLALAYYLLAADTPVDYIFLGNSYLHIAVITGDIKMIKLLLLFNASTKIENDYQRTALDIAKEVGFTEAVNLLSAIYDEKKPYQYFIKKGNEKLEEFIRLGNLEEIKKILNPLHINDPLDLFFNITPLHAACLFDQHDLVDYFLKCDANPNLSDSFSHETPLSSAVTFYKNRQTNTGLQTIRQLIQYNAHCEHLAVKEAVDNIGDLKDTLLASVDTTKLDLHGFGKDKLDHAKTLFSQWLKKPMADQALTADRIKNKFRITGSVTKVFLALGSGTYGNVSKGLWQNNAIAIKELNDNDNYSAHQNEIKFLQIMTLLQLPNIVTCYGFFSPSETSLDWIVMECLPQNLDRFLAWESNTSLSMKIQILIDVANGLKHLHAHSIIHRDVKASNVLLTSDNKAKLCDFGFSMFDNADAKFNLSKATYDSPEVIRHESPPTVKADIFGYGILMWNVVVNSRSYFYFYEDYIDEIAKGAREPIPSNCDPRLKEIINNCLLEEPTVRPDAETIIHQLKM